MNTQRLFYEDAYMTEFEATIEEIVSDDAGLWIRLNRTAFYPEGGGQPCDKGLICAKERFSDKENTAALQVADVQERNGEIWHRVEVFHGLGIDDALCPESMTAKGLTPQAVIIGQINWGRRLDLMQQHSGEHMVSGLIHKAYGYDNVGFHLSMDTMTLDLSGELSWEELMDIERAVNRLIRENLPVNIFYPSPEELKTIDYRSKKELSGEVRIVEVPGADTCACCGLHVSRTGEIGLVKMLSMQKWKNGVRIFMCCGERAENYARMLQEQNRKISVTLSAKPEETADAVARVSGELAKVKYELTGWKYRLFDAIAAANAGKNQVILFEEDLSMEDIRHLTDKLMKVCEGYCIVFSGDEENGYRYGFGQKGGDVRPMVKAMNEALNGRGGGKPELSQGTVRVGKAEIEAWVQIGEFKGCQN